MPYTGRFPFCDKLTFRTPSAAGCSHQLAPWKQIFSLFNWLHCIFTTFATARTYCSEKLPGINNACGGPFHSVRCNCNFQNVLLFVPFWSRYTRPGEMGVLWHTIQSFHVTFTRRSAMQICAQLLAMMIANAGMRRGTGADLKTGAEANEAHQIHLSHVQFRIRSFDKGGR